MGYLKTGLLLVGLTLLLLVLGDLVAGHLGALFAVLLSFFMIATSYFYADQTLLALYRTKPLSKDEPTGIASIVQSLIEKTKLPMPMLYLIETDAANACMIGRRPALVLTTGLLQTVDKAELTAIIARELSMIPQGDMLWMSVSALIANSITVVADTSVWASLFGKKDRLFKLNPVVMTAVGPIASFVVKLLHSNTREFELDRAGATLCDNPHAFISALKKLEAHQKTKTVSVASTHPATVSIFLINPLYDEKLSAQFATQPSTAERIKQLEACTN